MNLQSIDRVNDLTIFSDDQLPPGFVIFYSSPYSYWELGLNWITVTDWLRFALIYNDYPRRSRAELKAAIEREGRLLLCLHELTKGLGPFRSEH